MEVSGVFADRNLARRLEKAEALSLVELVRARARDFPESGARWLETAGVYAIFNGVASPATQTFGLGLSAPVTSDELEQLEAFFNEHAAAVYHTISSLADPDLWPLLNKRGYQPVGFTNVLFCALPETGFDQQQHRHLLVETAQDTWTGDWNEPADFMLGMAAQGSSQVEAHSLVAELPARPGAAGKPSFQEGVALLPASILLPPSQQGTQAGLLEDYLHLAAEHGCDLAMISTLPGSAVQRYAESEGFRIAYTRIKWQLLQAADYQVSATLSGELSANWQPDQFPG